MVDRWYRINETGAGEDTDPYRPDHVQRMGLEWTGNDPHPDYPGQWVVRVYGTEAELDDLTGKPGVAELPDIPVQALNNMTGQQRDAAGWERGFKVGQ